MREKSIEREKACERFIEIGRECEEDQERERAGKNQEGMSERRDKKQERIREIEGRKASGHERKGEIKEESENRRLRESERERGRLRD